MEARPLDGTSADELARVLALVHTVFGLRMDPAFYRWRFLASPFGAPLVTLLWDGDVLAGHYALSPMRSWLAGAPIATAQSMTTMTHPGYRNRGVFTQLAADLYARAEAAGTRMVWGMPNTQSHYGFRTKLAWRDIGVLFTMTRVLGDRDRAADPDAGIEILPGPPAGATALFARSDDGRFFASARDHAYLAWRYAAHPHHRYQFLTLPGAAADGLVVAKDYEVAPGRRALELVDYLYAGEPAMFESLLRALLPWAAARGYAMVRTWMALADPAFGALERLAFAPREPLTYVGGRTLGDFVLPPSAWTPAGCYLTMGDSDNY